MSKPTLGFYRLGRFLNQILRHFSKVLQTQNPIQNDLVATADLLSSCRVHCMRLMVECWTMMWTAKRKKSNLSNRWRYAEYRSVLVNCKFFLFFRKNEKSTKVKRFTIGMQCIQLLQLLFRFLIVLLPPKQKKAH